MEPLSVAASVVGLVAAAAKASSILTTLIHISNDAPNLVIGVLREVSEISACLSQLQSFLSGTRLGSNSRTALIQVEQLVVTLTSCVMSFSELEEILEPLKSRVSKQIGGRIAWMRKESVLSKLCARLSSSRASLNLMLTTLTWYHSPYPAVGRSSVKVNNLVNSASVEQAITSVDTLTSLVHQVLQSNQELRRRLGDNDARSIHKSVASTVQSVENDDEDDKSTIRAVRHDSHPILDISHAEEISSKSFTFEQDLKTSRVYTRVIWRRSLESHGPSAAPSFGWSCLSEISLADVSNISVISLPIAIEEISNGDHYPSPSVLIALRGQSMFDTSSRRDRPARPSPVRGFVKQIVVLGSPKSSRNMVCRQIQVQFGHESSDAAKQRVRRTISENLRAALLLLHHEVNRVGVISDLFEEGIAGCSSTQITKISRTFSDFINHKKFQLFWNGKKSITVFSEWDRVTVLFFVNALRAVLRDQDIYSKIALIGTEGVYEDAKFYADRLESLFVEDYSFDNIDIFYATLEPKNLFDKPSFQRNRYRIIDVNGLGSKPMWDELHGTADYILFTTQFRAACNAFAGVAASVTVPIILLFTKYDVFETSLATKPFSDFFPEYDGPTDIDSIYQYVASMFRRLHLRDHGMLHVYVVDASDIDEFKNVFQTIRTKVLNPVHTSAQQSAQAKRAPSAAVFKGFGADQIRPDDTLFAKKIEAGVAINDPEPMEEPEDANPPNDFRSQIYQRVAANLCVMLDQPTNVLPVQAIDALNQEIRQQNIKENNQESLYTVDTGFFKLQFHLAQPSIGELKEDPNDELARRDLGIINNLIEERCRKAGYPTGGEWHIPIPKEAKGKGKEAKGKETQVTNEASSARKKAPVFEPAPTVNAELVDADYDHDAEEPLDIDSIKSSTVVPHS